jgi:hypothetical protein
MSEQGGTKQSADVFRAIDELVKDAYNRSGLYPFYLKDSVRLTDSVELVRSKRSAPIWNCGPSVNIYGCLHMNTSTALSIANSLGLFVDLMSYDLIEAVEYFINETVHDDFYGYGNLSDNSDNFYDEAFLGWRPVMVFLVSSSVFGTYKDGFIYLLASENFSCRYGSYDDYYRDFFLKNMRNFLVSKVSDDSRFRDIMGYLDKNRSKLIQWFKLVDDEFLNAFDELNRRLDIFVKTLYRIEGTVEKESSRQLKGLAPWG